MDKRGAKILISCILCTVIVSILFLLAFRISRLRCELVSIEPQRLRAHQLETFDKKRNKPVRSHDKTILVKMSAYLEYNIMSTSSSADETETRPASEPIGRITSTPSPRDHQTSGPAANSSTPLSASGLRQVGASGSGQQHWLPSLKHENGSSRAQHPSPSQPELGFTQQQLANSSFLHAAGNSAQLVPQTQRAEKRFLPLELDSIETRNLATEGGASSGGGNSLSKHKYILSFNCTKLNMVFVYQGSRVFVESMSLELKPSSNHKTHCELELPKAGAFAVDSALSQSNTSTSTSSNSSSSSNNNNNNNNNNNTASKSSDHYAHYFCNKPLSYNCRHYSRNGPSSSNGLLLAELHISAIEFETATSTSGRGERKHVKQEFKSKRSECEAGA